MATWSTQPSVHWLPSVFLTPSSTSGRLQRVALSALFDKPEIVTETCSQSLVSSLFLKGSFTQHRLPGWPVFLSPGAVHRSWAAVVSGEKSALRRPVSSLKGMVFFFSFSCIYSFSLFLGFLAVLLWITEGCFAFY